MFQHNEHVTTTSIPFSENEGFWLNISFCVVCVCVFVCVCTCVCVCVCVCVCATV